jgi:hypothetical protein
MGYGVSRVYAAEGIRDMRVRVNLVTASRRIDNKKTRKPHDIQQFKVATVLLLL